MTPTIFYLGGGDYGNQVHVFDPQTSATSTVATLRFGVHKSLSIKTNDTVLILLGLDEELISFDMGTLNY